VPTHRQTGDRGLICGSVVFCAVAIAIILLENVSKPGTATFWWLAGLNLFLALFVGVGCFKLRDDCSAIEKGACTILLVMLLVVGLTCVAQVLH
jgi:hypothetical protein